MKKQLFLYIFLFFCSFVFSQENNTSNKESVIVKILDEQPNDYFKLKKLGGRKIPIDTLQKLNLESKKANYKLGQVYALHILGIRYRNRSEYNKAITALEESLELVQELNNRTLKIVLLNTIGSVYRRKDDIKHAMTYHQYALSELHEIENPTTENKKSKSIAENNIGNIYLQLKQYDLALEQFYLAVKTQESLNDLNGLALNHQNIGYTYEKMGEIDKALDHYGLSLDYNVKNNSDLGKLICNNNICGVLILKKEYEKALVIAEENFEFVKKLKDKYYYSQTISKLGWVYLKLGEIEKAKQVLEESIAIAEKYNYTVDYIDSSFHMSELYSGLGDSEKAFSYYKNAVEKERQTSGERSLLYINNLINKHNSQIKIEQLRSLKDQVKIRTFEFSRSRNVLIITLVSLALLSVALYSIYRQRLLNNDRRVLMLEQQALQAQMNPHFIFNALNSIKLYIINNDQKQAVYYLNKFSKLIRNILDVSKIKEVSLKEELKTMDLYMSIENIRFNNEIEYSAKINSSLNLDTIKVPPLVLQPFLENAIWHGLSSKEGEKKVLLSAFKVSKNLIEISIEDNGIGRKAAMQIKKNKNKSLERKSIGIDLTVERLKTFANDFMNDFSLKYYDLKDEKGNPKGTKVVLRIPLH